MHFCAACIAHPFISKGRSSRPSGRRSLRTQEKDRAVLSETGADGLVAHRVAYHRTRITMLFCADTVGAGSESRRCAIYSAARVVLPADFSVAEILARSSFRDRHSVNSHVPGAWHRGPSVF